MPNLATDPSMARRRCRAYGVPILSSQEISTLGDDMRYEGVAVAAILAVVVTGCSSDEQAPTMPDVVGMHLDTARTTIEQAGFLEDIVVDGGGALGVVIESNWTICTQSPEPGSALEDAVVSVSVDRECGDASPEATASAATLDPATAPDVVGMTLDVAEEALAGYVFDTYDTSGEDRSVWVASNWTVIAQRVEGDTVILDVENLVDSVESGEPSAEQAPLTIESNADLAKLLTSPEDGELMAEFATMYAGQAIEFDCVIAAMANHDGYETRYDILVAYGDDANTYSGGPSFQFSDVNMSDLNLVGDVPDTIGVNTKLHVIAAVGNYSSDPVVLQLEPVETSVR